jgi:hypothetical protein
MMLSSKRSDMEEEELKVNLLPALTGKTGEISPEVVLL